jgi:hypothetical protein
MRDTVISIILTQAPIAVGCLWVAWELHKIRRALETIARTAERVSEEQQP